MTMHDLSFSPHRRDRLSGLLKAMRANRIGLRKARTRLFPSNISVAIFLHLLEDPLSGAPRLVAYRAVDELGETTDTAVWTLSGEEDLLPAWQSFSGRFLPVWKSAIGKGKGPHVFHFGEKTWRGLRQWGELAGEVNSLSFLWMPDRLHHTDIRHLIREHFDFPAPGRVTLFALGRILGFPAPGEDKGTKGFGGAPESLFHGDPESCMFSEGFEPDAGSEGREGTLLLERILDLQGMVWKWALRHLESDFDQEEWGDGSEEASPAEGYLRFLEEERRIREEDVLSLQDYSLEERIERFRALGPLTFLGTSLDAEGRFLFDFQLPNGSSLSKFREEDFLKLVPVGSRDLQSGFPVILARYDHGAGQLSLLSRQGKPALSKRLAYSLEEDLSDWNHPKLLHAVRTVLSQEGAHPVPRLLRGEWTMGREREHFSWVRNWISTYEPVSTLNPTQRKALELPFRKRTSLIEGPPGTGKTHLLGWIIIALILQARSSGKPLRIAVSALTHQAIDGVLRKVAALVNHHHIEEFPARVMKWGRFKEEADPGPEPPSVEPFPLRIEALRGSNDIEKHPYLVLGSTGFGLYSLLESQTKDFPRIFDWIIFDEASQVLVPQALLALAYGKGRYLFLGDVKQLPPIVLGRYQPPDEDRGLPSSLTASGMRSPSPATPDAARSILEHLLAHYDEDHRIRLDVTYRMNEELCAFPSRMWYDGTLRPAEANAHSRLHLPSTAPSPSDSPVHRFTHSPNVFFRILDPQKPVVLVLADHRGCRQKSDLEAEIAAQLGFRLMTEYGLQPDQLAVISPHRAQNNTIAGRMRQLLGSSGDALPVIDTVERFQGAERDVILFSITASDPDHMMEPFLNNPNRFNVAITRARQKLIVVGSHSFFSAVPQSEEALRANRCFKEFFQFCRDRDAIVFIEGN